MLKSADIFWDSTTGLAQDRSIWRNLVEALMCHYGIAELSEHHVTVPFDTMHVNYKKDKAAPETIQRKAARFVTGNYDRTTSVTEMLQDLQWDTLDTMRRHGRLCIMYKMCHDLLDGDWGDY